MVISRCSETTMYSIFIEVHAVLFSIRGLQWDVVYLGWRIEPSYMSPNAGGKGGGNCGVSAGLSQWVQLYTGAQINFGDLTPYLTYVFNPSPFLSFTCTSIRNLQTNKTITNIFSLHWITWHVWGLWAIAVSKDGPVGEVVVIQQEAQLEHLRSTHHDRRISSRIRPLLRTCAKSFAVFAEVVGASSTF